MIIIFIGLWAIGAGQGDVSRVTQFKAGDAGMFWPVIAATTLAFFAMVGFEDSVNMAEECKDPTRHFPKVLLAGLFITGAIYVLVSISAITLVPPAQLGEGETPLLKVVQAGAPNFPVWIFGFITMFAVANCALINMLMASRLVYGMSREHVLPPVLGKVHATRRTPYIAIGFTTLLAFALITFVGEVPALGGTTALLLLCVFTVVNIAVLVLRKDTVAHEHFRTPTILPVLGAITCAFLAGPWTGRPMVQYQHRRRADRHRRRALGGHDAGQPRPGRQTRGAGHGDDGRRRARELEPDPEEWIPVFRKDPVNQRLSAIPSRSNGAGPVQQDAVQPSGNGICGHGPSLSLAAVGTSMNSSSASGKSQAGTIFIAPPTAFRSLL